ncbi:MAG: hypothetical protein RI560_08910 [Natronomonas sp.]|nr:hypothetical protein [Natronomonas sp.]
MSRMLVLVVVALMLFAAPLAADQMLQNEDTAVDTGNQTQQDDFAEASTVFFDFAPALLLALVVGVLLMAARTLGGL